MKHDGRIVNRTNYEHLFTYMYGQFIVALQQELAMYCIDTTTGKVRLDMHTRPTSKTNMKRETTS